MEHSITAAEIYMQGTYNYVTVNSESGTTTVFRHNQGHCDFSVFSNHQVEDIIEYIIGPVAVSRWHFTVDSEPGSDPE